MMFEFFIQQAAADKRILVHRGASEEEIASAERELGAALPGDYREFVRRWGWAELGYNDVLGLGPDADTGTSAVYNTTTMCDPEEEDGSWPSAHIVIYNVGNGDVCYLRTPQPYRGRVPVVRWDHELGEHTVCALSFEEWLHATLRDPQLIPPGPM
jgi:hypothetical protein